MAKQPAALPLMYSIAQLAAHLSVSRRTICRWIASGELRTHRLGRQHRVSAEDANSFVNQRRA